MQYDTLWHVAGAWLDMGTSIVQHHCCWLHCRASREGLPVITRFDGCRCVAAATHAWHWHWLLCRGAVMQGDGFNHMALLSAVAVCVYWAVAYCGCRRSKCCIYPLTCKWHNNQPGYIPLYISLYIEPSGLESASSSPCTQTAALGRVDNASFKV